jgi:hypothetical protein
MNFVGAPSVPQLASLDAAAMNPQRMTAANLPTSATLEASVAEALEACDGDLRATVRALIVANAFLEQELERAHALISRGYVRGRRLTIERLEQ